MEKLIIAGHKVEIGDVEFEDIDFWGPHERNEGGMQINWLSNIGFGQLTVVKRDGKIQCESEHMSNSTDKRFIKLVLQKLIDSLEVVE